MYKAVVRHISQEGGLHVDEYCWTLDKPMASLSTCNLGLWLGWLLLLNLVKSQIEHQRMGTLTLFIIKSDSCASRAWNICKITVAVLQGTLYKDYK